MRPLKDKKSAECYREFQSSSWHLQALQSDSARLWPQAGIGFESLTEKIETGSAAGRLVFHVFAALAEFERNITRERTLAGLAAARARGRSGGRPGITPEKRAALEVLASDPKKRPGEICKALGISRATFYKYATSRGGSTA